jgi:hypothetical protein
MASLSLLISLELTKRWPTNSSDILSLKTPKGQYKQGQITCSVHGLIGTHGNSFDLNYDAQVITTTITVSNGRSISLIFSNNEISPNLYMHKSQTKNFR